jgi:hypothetical protein
MNYLSFSLWGDKPFYNVGAIRNSELIKTVYPDWKMILYYDNTTPQETIKELLKNDVLCIDVTEKNIYGPFWRFYAADLPDAEYVCFRDCDSRISEREYLAVVEWINSGKTLHVMRDHPAHRIPYGNDEMGILAGMWGLKTKKIFLTEMINDFCKNNQPTYGADQKFLKYIYKTFKNDKCTHDEFFEKIPFPIKRQNGRFIGERININEQPLTNDHLALL